LVEPLIRRAQRRLRAGFRALRRQGAAGTLLDGRLEEALLENAARQLLQLLAPTLVLEMNVARIEGRLAGGTQERRFASFVERLRKPAAALALLREYPVLARRITACLDNWTVFSLEFARRLVGDLEELRTCLAAGEEPGTIVGLDNSQGDPHQNGRSVLIATFSSGLRVVYKPRPLAAARHFQELLTWLNAKGAAPPLRTLKILDRGTYGWIEFVAGEGCTSVGEVRRFYERQGEFLALLYALEATDFHYENLIAAGEHPVLVDLETLLQPHIRHPGQAIGRAFRDSVLRIGLLPQRLFAGPEGDGIDLSGLSAVGGQALPYQVLHYESQGTDEMHAIRETGTSTGAGNQPTLNGAAIELLDHVDAILIGFRTMYRLLHRHRDELLSRNGPLARFAQDAVRVVLRPTLTYGLLLEAGRHPDALRDALELDMMLGSLWTATQGEGSLERIFPFEIEDLHGQDIPLFTTRPASRDLWTSTGRVVPGFFAETGMALARRRLRRLGDSDFARQVWFIKASLATTARGRVTERQRPKAARRTRRGADRASLLTAAVAIGDRLEALALEGDDDVAWIGLTLTSRENWSLVPLGTDLYDGLPGVAFFLAHLGQVTGDDRYTRLAGSALRTIRRQLARTPLRSLSIGAFEGLGGHIFLLTHLGIAWHEPELLIEARRNAASIRELVAGDRRFDITGGAAGCIMCLLALHHAAPGDDVLTTAVACGDHLLAHAEPQEEGLAWAPYFPAKGPLTGLAHGASGIAWALLELFGASGESRFRDAALAAMAYENRFFSAEKGNWADLRETDSPAVQAYMVGWCHGAPGIGLARLQALKHIDGAGISRRHRSGAGDDPAGRLSWRSLPVSWQPGEHRAAAAGP
ncbi:MAG: type 2 lanthipeptide synthetase LanM family protein, partial [Geminicoccaceae bacterium]